MALTARIDSKAKKLIIEVELEASPKASKSGKTTLIASSHGNTATTAEVNGKPVIIGLNAYTKP